MSSRTWPAQRRQTVRRPGPGVLPRTTGRAGFMALKLLSVPSPCGQSDLSSAETGETKVLLVGDESLLSALRSSHSLAKACPKGLIVVLLLHPALGQLEVTGLQDHSETSAKSGSSTGAAEMSDMILRWMTLSRGISRARSTTWTTGCTFARECGWKQLHVDLVGMRCTRAYIVITILPPPPWPSTRYRMACGTWLRGRVLSMTAVTVRRHRTVLPAGLRDQFGGELATCLGWRGT
jgi:hypothetical protein